MANSDEYIKMQLDWYNKAAGNSRYDSKNKQDSVVGSYEAHDQWADYDRFLMRGADTSYKEKYALDFACGPGRNIVRYSDRFKRMDGADISPINLKNAKQNLEFHKIDVPNLYCTNGSDLGNAQDNFHFLISTIALQHICVHEVRFKIMENMFRALRKGGKISIQMGFGYKPGGAGYYDNVYDATSTNSGHDTMVENSDYLEDDLNKIGFSDFQYWVRPVGPGDSHAHWIFFQAEK